MNPTHKAAIAVLRLATRLEADQARIALLDLLAIAPDPLDALLTISNHIALENQASEDILAGLDGVHSRAYCEPDHAASLIAASVLIGSPVLWGEVGSMLAASVARADLDKAVSDAGMML